MQAPLEIHLNAFYSNGSYGRSWGVRQVVELTQDAQTGQVQVAFRGIAGRCRRKTGECTLNEFQAWARHEVRLNENSWLRVGFSEETFPPPEEAAY